jgi:4-methyl-5(b-hydroxyethyl)-thiazole monophosphate biosynthesis
MEKKIYLFLAEGFEEVEGLTVVDILRRSGLGCTTVSIMETKEVTGSHKITIQADCLLREVDFSSADMLILPGGMPGTTNLGACEVLTEQLKSFHEKGKMLGAICAAPGVLGQNGILKGKKAACYPGCENNLIGAEVVFTETAVDGNIITSRGMGTAIPFGLAIVEHFLGKEAMEKLKKSIVYQQV